MNPQFLRSLENRQIDIDSNVYDIFIKRSVVSKPEATKLVVVSHLPNSSTKDILDVCIKSLQRYTIEEHELWVVDNNSPEESVKWLQWQRGINIIFNRSKHIDNGSYDNGVALELAARVIDQETRYMMVLHQDTVVCRNGWLTEMLSKMSDKTKAVGVRLDKARVFEGVLHVLGFIIDFQTFKALKLSFLPHLPDADTGDLVTVRLREAGYNIFSFPNSFNNPEVIKILPDISPFKNINIDRTLDEDGRVFFLHLGRGVVKSTAVGDFTGKVMPEEWVAFARNLLQNVVKPNPDKGVLSNCLFNDNSYSVRRYFVDEFYFREIEKFKDKSTILDMGGKKKNKRGVFDIDKYNLHVKYANMDVKTEPDYLCDLTKVPVEDNLFDGVILSEVLEHIPEPELVLREANRVLKPGGIALICVPFMYHRHADPFDFWRFTDDCLYSMLAKNGFTQITIEKQGLFFSVLVYMLKIWIYEYYKEGRFRSQIVRSTINKLITFGQRKALNAEQKEYYKNHKVLGSFTTGYGITAIKI